MDLLTLARYFAVTEHVTKRGQSYGILPYSHHLADVENVLLRHGVRDIEYRAAAWLHDVVEDCDGVKRKHIEEMFGERVADLVEAVTADPGPNRRTRNALTYERTRAVEGGVVLKLADRIANVENGGPLVEMYRREHESFHRALHGGKILHHHLAAVNEMWTKLDSLLLRTA
jgi:(p)ppGpp synthase/HD superfamily hydrolase